MALLFTGEEPLYLPRYLAPVLDAHADAFEAVVIAPPARPRHDQVRRQYRMLGPRAFARLGAKAVRRRLLDVLPGDGHGSVASLARAHDVPVWHAPDVSDPAFVERVRAVDPGLLLSVVAGQRLPGEVLEATDDAVNLHGSLLPKYRGRAVAFWPLYHGDDETGVTAHLMTEEFDAGPIVERRSFPLDGESMHEVYLRLADVGADLACDLLDAHPTEFQTRPNETTDSDYHSVPTPEQRREFLCRGNRFV